MKVELCDLCGEQPVHVFKIEQEPTDGVSDTIKVNVALCGLHIRIVLTVILNNNAGARFNLAGLLGAASCYKPPEQI